MKKNCFFVILSFVLMLFTACNVNDLKEPEPDSKIEAKSTAIVDNELAKINFSVDDNCLNFETKEDFETLLDYLVSKGDSFFPEFEDIIGFESYRQHHVNDTTDVIEDDLIATVINPGAEIQIAGYLFKIDFDNEVTLVYRIPADVLMTKSRMFNQIEPVAYGWDYDFFDDDEIMTKGRFCGSSDQKVEHSVCRAEGTAGNISSFGVKTKLCYQRFTFIKTIISKIKTSHDEPLGKPQDFGVPNIEAQVKFRMQVTGTFQRKGDKEKITVNVDRAKVVNVKSNNEDISWRPFYGTRRVRNYDLISTFSMIGHKNTDIDPGNNYISLGTLSMKCH